MLLKARGLGVRFGAVHALDGFDLALEEGECRGLLGESGSGKSTLARTLLGITTDAEFSGSLHLGELDLLHLSSPQWRAIRWREVALAFQAPSALNPGLHLDLQVMEPMEQLMGLRRREARARALSLLERVGLASDRHHAYPGELSTGQKRLGLVAIALACNPRLLILDEPTSGLDPLTRQTLLGLLGELRNERSDRAMLVLGHDVEALHAIADSVQMLYAGRSMEVGPAKVVLEEPRHPYSWALLNSRPSLATVKEIRGIPGDNPDPTHPAVGCPFVPRCPQTILQCSAAPPPLLAVEGRPDHKVSCIRSGIITVLSARGVHFSHRGPLGRRIPILHGIDVDLRAGEIVGIVGSTGAGKTTLAMCLTGHLPLDSGRVVFGNTNLRNLRHGEHADSRAGLQMLFQDPFEATSARLTVEEIVREPLDLDSRISSESARELVGEALVSVHLPCDPPFLRRRSHELSGGQLQRLGLARALIVQPRVLVADEPVAMLDPSEQAKALQLLKRLQVERGLALILISHDMAVVLRVADRVLVLEGGKVIDRLTGDRLMRGEGQPLTRRLLMAAGVPRIYSEEDANESR